MLKRLELVGFKSFADKTVFDFHPGITAIVGPNGSGKSNIVDAVRWIMGEQSAKSLRGGEMADVIFNGSSSRKGFGLAEVSMIFDNAKKQLATELEEVQITRRVHRDGEGEYLINGQVCRLRDIKELFLGSGAGNDAYCIIEQGKVDVLLQASTKDRRIIFEEAAGISRFKAKKIETLRKLERVDQNLSRVKDIIEEVEKQHRSVKLQASKAQRWQEYSDRLKELRLTMGRTDHRRLSERLTAEETALEAMRLELDQRAARAGACEAEAERLEMLLADLEDELREEEARLARIRQDIKARETTLTHEDALAADLETEWATTRRRTNELTGRVRTLVGAVAETAHELADITAQAEREGAVAAGLEADLQQTLGHVQSLQEEMGRDKAEHLELMRRAAHLQNDAVATRAHVDNLLRERQRLEARSSQAAESLATIDVELQELESADGALHQRLATARQDLIDKRESRERLRQDCEQKTVSIAQLRERRSGLASRIEVLEGLIRSHEGLGAGPREVFRLLETNPGWGGVLGMLADFLTVKHEHAHLIDLALGDQAQRFLVRDAAALEQALAERGAAFPGRVSFLPIKPAPVASAPGLAHPASTQVASSDNLKENPAFEFSVLSRLKQLDGGEHAALVVPADQLVSCDHPDLSEMPAQTLGRTLLVRDLSTARRLAPEAPGFRFLTLQGELLEADGALTVGTQKVEAGFLARKSELASLQDQVTRLDFEVDAAQQRLSQARTELDDDARWLEDKQQEIDVLAEQAADFRARVTQYRDRRQGLHDEVTLQRDELQKLDQEAQTLEASWRQAHNDAALAEQKVQELHVKLHKAEETLHQLDQERQKKAQAFTAAQISQAKVEERRAGVQSRHEQQERDLRQRQAELAAGEQALVSCHQRSTECQMTMLSASAALAHLHLDKEARQAEIARRIHERDTRRQDRGRLAQQAQTVRAEWRTQQDAYHQRELAANDLRHERQTLVDRIKEDYQIDLNEDAVNRDPQGSVDAELPETKTPDLEDASADSALRGLTPPGSPQIDPAAAQEEIEELRRKLSRLGNVNLAALDELQELEGRAASLRTQYDDLISAKKSLEEIIGKINVDSRKLFQDTFVVIRGHFQELFRKLFGGGMADVVLEDEADVLESGIEIIARPPGKELRSISLMSGGEKTLTAVALLLAIFRSKPSPFCLLDEVDAALDEANIGRFTAVLRDFLDLSQFIIVTHSKKTMAVADVLYGITMQESGISKQVAVRFEDWVDENAQPTAQTA